MGINASGLAAKRDAFRNGILADARLMLVGMVAAIKPGIRVVDVPLLLGAQGVALTASNHVFFRLGLNGQATILTWSLAGTVAGASHTGTVTLDILVGSTVATVASICGTSKPALSAVAELADQVPAASWTVQISDPQWILVKPTAVDGTLEVVSLTLRCAVDSR